jgi:hypothetical protein
LDPIKLRLLLLETKPALPQPYFDERQMAHQPRVAPTLLGNWMEERAAIEAAVAEDLLRRREAREAMERQMREQEEAQMKQQIDPKAEEKRKVMLRLWEQAV